MITKQYTYRLDEIEAVASKLLEEFNSKVILFNGEMGTGKTTLIKALLAAMGSKDDVTSPTFSIVNEYEIVNDKVYHFDFYRINDIEEVYNFGIEDYLTSKHWLFMEWSERIEDVLPNHVCVLDIQMIDPEERTLKLTIRKQNLTLKTHIL